MVEGFDHAENLDLPVWEQLLARVTGIAAVGTFAMATSYGIFILLKKSNEFRVTEHEEIEGPDVHEHGTAAYSELKYE